MKCIVCEWPLDSEGRCTQWAGPPHDGWPSENDDGPVTYAYAQPATAAAESEPGE